MDLLENNIFFSSNKWECQKYVQEYPWLTTRRPDITNDFFLAATMLTQLFLRAQSLGELSRLKASLHGQGVPLLQYADDMLVMVAISDKEAQMVKKLLIWFEAASYLKVNPKKFVLYEINRLECGYNTQSLVGHRRSSFHDHYLAIPLGAKAKSVAVWEPLIERIRGILTLWKRSYLSKGEKSMPYKVYGCQSASVFNVRPLYAYNNDL